MSHDQQFACIEVVVACDLPKVAKAAADVLKRTGPASTGIADSAVFDIPRGDSFGGERGTKMRRMRQVVLGSPEAAMNIHGRRKGPFALGHSDVAKLIRVAAVG